MQLVLRLMQNILILTQFAQNSPQHTSNRVLENLRPIRKRLKTEIIVHQSLQDGLALSH